MTYTTLLQTPQTSDISERTKYPVIHYVAEITIIVASLTVRFPFSSNASHEEFFLMNSPQSFFTSNNYGVVDIKSAKKKQIQIKTITGSFVKLMNNWAQDVSQIDSLLYNLRNLISTAESVHRLETRHPQPFPLFEIMFTDVYSLLIGKIYSEIEAIYHQLMHYA
jgi:hypothetical protein